MLVRQVDGFRVWGRCFEQPSYGLHTLHGVSFVAASLRLAHFLGVARLRIVEQFGRWKRLPPLVATYSAGAVGGVRSTPPLIASP